MSTIKHYTVTYSPTEYHISGDFKLWFVITLSFPQTSPTGISWQCSVHCSRWSSINSFRLLAYICQTSNLPPCWDNEETLCVFNFTVRQRQVQPRQKSSNYTNSTKTESLSHLNARCNQVRHTLSVCSQCSEDSWHRYVSGLDGMFYIPASEGNLTIHNRSLF